MRPLVIGLTGPIGCGKSTVSGWLAELGAAVVDADALVRDVLVPGAPETEAVVRRFGAALRWPDGSVDRAGLASIVFRDPSALADLEAIVHPAVRARILAALAGADRAGVPAVVIEAIKLIEGGLAASCDEVWLVDCDREAQRARLLGRDIAPDDADRRMAAQAGLADRVRPIATRIVDSSGEPAATRAAVEAAFAEALASRPRPGAPEAA